MCGGGLIELSSTATAINKKLTLPAALYRFMDAFRPDAPRSFTKLVLFRIGEIRL